MHPASATTSRILPLSAPNANATPLRSPVHSRWGPPTQHMPQQPPAAPSFGAWSSCRTHRPSGSVCTGHPAGDCGTSEACTPWKPQLSCTSSDASAYLPGDADGGWFTCPRWTAVLRQSARAGSGRKAIRGPLSPLRRPRRSGSRCRPPAARDPPEWAGARRQRPGTHRARSPAGLDHRSGRADGEPGRR
jgi:hypothetical protein